MVVPIRLSDQLAKERHSNESQDRLVDGEVKGRRYRYDVAEPFHVLVKPRIQFRALP